LRCVFNRLNQYEQKELGKRLAKFDFRLIDDPTLKSIRREMENRKKWAVMKWYDFYNWSDKVLFHNCNGCTKHSSECELHQIFQDNFLPESSWGMENCRYATNCLIRRRNKVLDRLKKILCLILGHIPERCHEKDCFGYEYVWQKVYCKRCGKRLE
jgi:hypothetical protein